MVCMEKESSRSVTFTKRRFSLFKKASELTTHDGAELAIIVFSPGRKAFSFGYPSVCSVLDHYQNDTSFFNYLIDYQIGQASERIQDEEGGNIKELLHNLIILETQYETEKKRSEKINNRKQTHEEMRKWMAMVENTKILGELHKIQEALTHLNTILHQLYHVIELNANNGDVAGYRYPPNLLENQKSFPYNNFGDQLQIKL
ncbi:agamous-like MADS-box protein AGL62 [Amaranthus tricolor]|uniref:agamous-like MADS-box protein AGL62 n=1 Tax=Amaranthus tricolor TaxID=29722 RepID=UPI002583AC6F|nr:agamous-like MADS-box protein AGL62 [Amaranthus tricolor]